MASQPFRLSIIDYLNAAPLNHGFKHGLGWEHFHLKFHLKFFGIGIQGYLSSPAILMFKVGK